MNESRIILLLIVCGLLVHFGKHLVVMSFLRHLWATNRLVACIIAFVVAYAFFPAIASSGLLLIFGAIGVFWMMRRS